MSTQAEKAVCAEILAIMRTYHEQEASASGVDTPGRPAAAAFAGARRVGQRGSAGGAVAEFWDAGTEEEEVMAKQGEHGISWSHFTFNPWWGCVEVSPACGLPMPGHDEDEPHGGCYARELDKRFPILGQAHWGKDAPRRFFGDAYWAEPLKWNRQAEKSGERYRVFCASMCDVLEDRMDLDTYRIRLWALIEVTPYLDWLLLTKRPQNYRKMLPRRWFEHPPRSVWPGTTVESKDYLWRAEEICRLPFAIPWISAEPLLGPVDFSTCVSPAHWTVQEGENEYRHREDCPCNGTGWMPPGIRWIVAGGESGRHARPAHPQWFRQVRDQCKEAGVAFHFKQQGEYSWDNGGGFPDAIVAPDGTWAKGCPLGWGSDYPRSASLYRVGKKASGRLLDGVLHDEFPEVRNA